MLLVKLFGSHGGSINNTSSLTKNGNALFTYIVGEGRSDSIIVVSGFSILYILVRLEVHRFGQKTLRVFNN